MFLTVLIPGLSNPKHNIDVYLQPLIDELCMLWNDGILTYDMSLRQNFMIKTINDFPAYEMLSGWGDLDAPYERTKAFTLKHSHKVPILIGHCQFLPLHHPYKRNKNSFKKRCVETSHPPSRLSSLDMWKRVAHLPFSYDLLEE
ncbi:hypothetical protein CR513_28955, partial [Mucuna pruriens]